MISVYEFKSYKDFVREWVKGQPKEGRGIFKRMAEKLATSSTMMSHVFQGDKDLSFEMAHDLAEFLGLNETEGDYFLLLVQYSKAGSFALQRRLAKRIAAEQKRVSDLSTRVKPDKALAEVIKAKFYSHWAYTGIRNLSACPEFHDVDSISRQLGLTRTLTQKIVDFLVEHELCVIEKGKLTAGPRQTHIGQNSELVYKHHQNWRLHAITKMADPQDANLFFTAPMSLSRDTAEIMRQKIPKFIEEVSEMVRPSPSEVVRCLNIDWFEY